MTTPSDQKKPRNHALFIGVRDYAIYDRSAGNPAGTSDVPGALNDVRTWYRQCIAMGFAAENIRVLTSPRLSPEALGPSCPAAHVGEATHDGMIDGIRWLCEVISGDEPSSGLLTFSGHGERDGGLLLCPSDVTASLDEVISVAKLRAAMDVAGTPELDDRLTVLLDCCRSQAGIEREQTIAATLAARAARIELPEGARGVRERAITACREGQTSESSTFGGEAMGAFTWAMSSTMGQWKATEKGGVVHLDASYSDLVDRSRALLRSLSFVQEPTLSGPRGFTRQAFLAPGDAPVSRQPDGTRTKRQLDVGINPATNQRYASAVYTFSYSTDGKRYIPFVQALVIGDNDVTYSGDSCQAHTEYWYGDPETINDLNAHCSNSGLKLQISNASYASVNAGAELPIGSKMTDYEGSAPQLSYSAPDCNYTSSTRKNIVFRSVMPNGIQFGVGFQFYKGYYKVDDVGHHVACLNAVFFYWDQGLYCLPNGRSQDIDAVSSTNSLEGVFLQQASWI